MRSATPVPTSSSVQITGSINTPAGIGIGANSITNAELVQRAPFSVMGNPTAIEANVQDIAAAADGEFLQRSAGVLVWGPIATGDSLTGFGTPTSPLELVGDVLDFPEILSITAPMDLGSKAIIRSPAEVAAARPLFSRLAAHRSRTPFRQPPIPSKLSVLAEVAAEVVAVATR